MKKSFILTFALISNVAVAEIQLSPYPLNIGEAKQVDATDKDGLVVINQKGELWQIQGEKTQLLMQNVSPKIAPKAGYGRIALADNQGNFTLWTTDKIYRSTIPMAEKATMQPLGFATIGVVKQENGYKLARIETEGKKAKITALTAQNVLPDARPLQVNFNGDDHKQGHIAVFAEPDSETYQHGVLGDDMEAKKLLYVERHTLEPLAESLSQKELVFEANQLSVLTQNNQRRLVGVMSGNGEGARTVLVGLNNGKLTIEAESQPLPSNRWQSPFVFNQHLYAVQMPHLLGRLVEYRQNGKWLNETEIEKGLSNHSYGTYETNLVAATSNFAVIPQYGYTQVSVMDKQGKLTKLSNKLPAEMIKSVADKNRVYLLLNNGQIWIVEDK